MDGKNNNILIMTVGLPRSGKSTWAKQQQGIPIVNPDSIRLAIHGKAFDPKYESLVWSIAHIMVNSLFIAGHNKVIFDATNVTQKRRNEWLNPDLYDIKYVIFYTDVETCIQRAIQTDQQYLIPVIKKMASEFNIEAIIEKNMYYT